MWKRILQHLAFMTFTALVAGSITAVALPQDPANASVAEAARRARQQKKKSEKPVPVVTEDTLKPAPPVATNSAEPAPQNSSASSTGSTPISLSTGDTPTPAADATASAAAGESDAAIKALKRQLAEAQKDLELSQLDLSLQQDTYFSNPDYIHDKAGKEKLDTIQQDVTQKQQVVDRLKIKLAALELQNHANSSAPARP